MNHHQSPPPGAAHLLSASRGSSRRPDGLFPILGWSLLVLCLLIVFGTSVADACGLDDAVRDACVRSASFCFPSTLVGFGTREEDSCQEPGFRVGAGGTSSEWRPGNVAAFKIANGGVVTCSLVDFVGGVDDGLSSGGTDDFATCMAPLIPDVWMRTSSGMTADLNEHAKGIDLGLLSSSFSTNVEISPPYLDYGENTLYTPSIQFLTVTNTFKNGILHVYKPFSTHSQYYAYGFQKLALAPGESASIAFVFWPRWLGSSSAHLVLQTSFGGFIILVRGVATESPIKIDALTGIKVPFNKRLSRNFSLHNPFDDALHVEEVSAWVSLAEHTNQSVHVGCRINALQPPLTEFGYYLTDDEWFRVESSKLGLRWLDIRPHKQWEVSAHETGPIVEMSLWPYTEGKVLGAICLKMRSSGQDRAGTIVLPLELEVHGKTSYSDLSGSVSVHIEALEPSNGREIVLIISIRNGADLLSLINVSEVTESSKLFKVRYKQGLLLFPGTVTKIALVSYSSPSISHDIMPEIPNESVECKLLIVTNDSASPVITIPCLDLVYAISNSEHGSGIIASDGSYISWLSQTEEEKYTIARTGSLHSIAEALFPIRQKLMEAFEADDLILGNWRSQGTIAENSVLEERELLFPMVPVGTHFSKWITVHNPSQQPVIMQLVFNSGEVIGQCKSADEIDEHTFLNRFTKIDSRETRMGFSVSDSAITETFVYPSESVLLGPVVFHPLNRCMWRSTALVRNNLSGVEWLPIQAFGGSHLLILLEGSEHVWKLDFNFHWPINTSSADFLSHIENTSSLCSHRLSKEIYAKNIGELPLEVKKLKVPGTDCGLDGFMIHRCKGFSLEPGESVRLLISYEPDFSTAAVHRDLELALATGIFVIPMKASLPVYMLNLCRKTVFQAVDWKASLLILAVGSTLILLLIYIIPHSFLLGTEEYFDKVDNTLNTMGKAGKTSCLQHSAKSPRSFREDKNPKAEFVNEYHICQNVMLDYPKKAQSKQDFGHQKEMAFSPQTFTTNSVEVFDKYNMLEAPQSGSLTIRVVKENGRRRKRRATTGLAARLEVSSSQSGNSTPSSPLSPNASTPKQACPLSPERDNIPFAGLSSEQKHLKKHDAEDTMGTIVSETEKHSERVLVMPDQKQYPATTKATGRRTISPSVKFPESGWCAPSMTASSVLATCSPISPYSRAPGPKSSKDKAIKMEENSGVGKEFTYDIWGNHFSDNFLFRQKELTTKMPDASEGDSQSFFARDPQSLVMMSSAWSISPWQKLPSDNVNFHNEMN